MFHKLCGYNKELNSIFQECCHVLFLIPSITKDVILIRISSERLTLGVIKEMKRQEIPPLCESTDKPKTKH